MKKITMIAMFVILTISAMAQKTTPVGATATANIYAKILATLTLTKNVDLNFGTMAIPLSPGTVTVSPAGIRTYTGGVILLTQAPVATASSFTTNGDPGAVYSITLPTSNIIITSTVGSYTMPVNLFISSNNNSGTLNSVGADTFTVGATLNLGTTQQAGSYVGQYQVTVNYN